MQFRQKDTTKAKFEANSFLMKTRLKPHTDTIQTSKSCGGGGGGGL
jgi:hypothetical protein